MALQSDFVYNRQPFTATDDREEYFLVEVPGIFVPECDFIYYGLLESKYSEELFKLREQTSFNVHDIYNNHMYLTATDLIAYLSSPNEHLDKCDADYLGHLYVTALDTYKYNPANETMVRHALIEAAMYDFVKAVCLVYPWGVRDIDLLFLSKILPSRVQKKIRHFSGTLMEAIKDRPHDIPYYTTIATNSIEDVHDMIDHAQEYKTDQAFYMLRNHSGNTKMWMVSDPEDPSKLNPHFEEVGTKEILDKLMTSRGVPKGQMRFARFIPYLYSDRKPNNENFLIGT